MQDKNSGEAGKELSAQPTERAGEAPDLVSGQTMSIEENLRMIEGWLRPIRPGEEPFMRERAIAIHVRCIRDALTGPSSSSELAKRAASKIYFFMYPHIMIREGQYIPEHAAIIQIQMDEAITAARASSLAELTAERDALRAALEGQPIETAPKGRKIIVRYFNALGKPRTVMARYYLENTLDCDFETNESGYAPEGWYEECETQETICPVEGEPARWWPLPAHTTKPDTNTASGTT